MCFSSHASYISSAILFPAGIYGVIKSLNANKQYLLLSLIPLIFSLQQLSEGIIWDALALQRYDLIDYGALTYLFFAYLFWQKAFCLSPTFASHPNASYYFSASTARV